MEDIEQIVQEFLDAMIETAMTEIEEKPKKSIEKPQKVKPGPKSRLIQWTIQSYKRAPKRAQPKIIYGDIIQRPISDDRPSWTEDFGKLKLKNIQKVASPSTSNLNKQHEFSQSGVNLSSNKGFGKTVLASSNSFVKDQSDIKQYGTSNRVSSGVNPSSNKDFGATFPAQSTSIAKDQSNVKQHVQVPPRFNPINGQGDSYLRAPTKNFVRYDWKQTQVPIIERLPFHVMKSFNPRTKPRFFNVHIDKQVIQMQKTGYLIAYCNGFISVGVIKHRSNIGNKPLTIQFGNYDSFDGKDLHVGSTVIVKSYAQIYNSRTGYFRPHATKENTFDDLKKEGSLYSCAQAIEWAIIEKPEVVTTLGTVRKMYIDRRDNYLLFNGHIHDREYNTMHWVNDDFWPSYIKDAPEINSAILIRWIKLEEPYMIYRASPKLPIVLPGYAQYYLETENKGDVYWLSSLDTGFRHT